MPQTNIEVLFSEESIQQKVKELGKQISEDYKDKEVVFLGILSGSFIFMSDLVRALSIDVECEFMRIASYHNSTTSSGKIDLLLDVNPKKIKDKHIIITEDIVDTGRSMHFLLEHIAKYEPASLKICSFLFKEEMLEKPITIDYLGFKIDPLFVVGYGLDFAGKYRNLPYVGVYSSDS